jgi:hypothetical protein
MRIKILAQDSLDLAAHGWRLSRDVNSHVKWQDVFAVDVPVNELPSMVVHFEDFTILEREIMASPRNHVMWARTSHVDDAADFRWPSEFVDLDPEEMRRARAKMRSARDAGLSQDEYRFDMPVLALTSWTQRISYRDLVKMAVYLQYLQGEVHDSIKLLIGNLQDEVEKLVAKFTGNYLMTEKVMETFLPVKFLHEGDLRVGTVSETEGFITVPMVQPLWMRAQIVRHRNLGVVDTFFLGVLANPDVTRLTINHPIFMELSSTKDFWQTILSKRTCWLAQDTLATKKDLWQEIVDKFGFREDMLPCASGRCPYAGDAALRLTDADPGVPCPRYCNIEGIDKQLFVEDMYVAARSRHEFWMEEINA